MKSLYLSILLLFLVSCNVCFSQKTADKESVIERRSYTTSKSTTTPKIDGVISKGEWSDVEWATGFTQVEPKPGEGAKQLTRAKLIYDDDALYVLGEMTETEEIFTYLSERDDPGNADWFGFVVDSYNEGTNALGFFVTAAGVQMEAKYSANGEDFAWNAVWKSAVKVIDGKWVVEMKIPYAALRFPNGENQLWGVHFWRNRRVNRELDTWNPIKPDIDGFINQSGLLKGIGYIETPVRLAFFPYISLGVDHFPVQKKFVKDLNPNFNIGMDVKYGINDAFTLDMTLVPDFSQVVSDDYVLNLSPFEVRFNENRQFFTEGTELFNKSGLFYSRRIGGEPLGLYDVEDKIRDTDEIIKNPISNQLLNATKVSGRTAGGLGIGVFNAFESQTFATVTNAENDSTWQVKTSPFTNYNIVVLDQDLPGNSSVTLTNTNVSRFDDDFYDANVTGFDTRLNNQNNKYSFRTEFALSQKSNGAYSEPELGYKAGASFNKISGNFLYILYYGIESDKYDPNDLGFLFSPNEKVWFAEVNYNIYKPFWKFNNLYSGFNMVYERLFSPNKFANFGLGGYVNVNTNGFTTLGTDFNLEPIETYDFFEPRTSDFETYYKFPENISWGAFVSSNYSKPFALDVNWQLRWFNEPNRWALNLNISPRMRPTGKLLIVPRLNIYNSYNETGYSGSFASTDEGIPFGIRNIRTVSPVLQFDYVLNNKMVIKARIRHNWTTTRYNNFGYLNNEGTLDLVEVEDLTIKDVNFNAFTVDIAYRWVFAPGSEMSLVWKNTIVGDDFMIEDRYLKSVGDMFDSPIQKGLSLRLLYFFDYNYIKSWKKQKAKV